MRTLIIYMLIYSEQKLKRSGLQDPNEFSSQSIRTKVAVVSYLKVVRLSTSSTHMHTQLLPSYRHGQEMNTVRKTVSLFVVHAYNQWSYKHEERT